MYEVYSSHDNRRTFATYFEGKLKRSLIMQITGHDREHNYKKYVGIVNENIDGVKEVFDKTAFEIKTAN